MNTVGISSNDKSVTVAAAVTTDVTSKCPPTACTQTSTPLIHCYTDNVVIQVAPLLYQSLHQVVDVTSIRMC